MKLSISFTLSFTLLFISYYQVHLIHKIAEFQCRSSWQPKSWRRSPGLCSERARARQFLSLRWSLGCALLARSGSFQERRDRTWEGVSESRLERASAQRALWSMFCLQRRDQTQQLVPPTTTVFRPRLYTSFIAVIPFSKKTFRLNPWWQVYSQSSMWWGTTRSSRLTFPVKMSAYLQSCMESALTIQAESRGASSRDSFVFPTAVEPRMNSLRLFINLSLMKRLDIFFSDSEDTPKTKLKIVSPESGSSASGREPLERIQKIVGFEEMQSLPKFQRELVEQSIERVAYNRGKAVFTNRRLVVLLDYFYDLPLSLNQRLQLFPPQDTPVLFIPNKFCVLINSPQSVVAPTSVCQFNKCLRRLILKETVSQSGQKSKEMLWGSLVHKAFERAQLKRDSKRVLLSLLQDEEQSQDEEWLYRAIKEKEKQKQNYFRKIQQEFLLDIFDLRLQVQEFKNKLALATQKVALWKKKYLDQKSCVGYGKFNLVVEEVLEQQLWLEETTKNLGIKGQVDLVVRAKIIIEGQAESLTCICPVQIKTGKLYDHYLHQVQFYMLMLMQHYKQSHVYGLIYSVDNDQFKVLEPDFFSLSYSSFRRSRLLELRQVISKKDGQLPQLDKDVSNCRFCEMKLECVGYKEMQEVQDPKTFEFLQELRDLKGLIKLPERVYLKKWFDALKLQQKFVSVSKDSKLLKHFVVKQNRSAVLVRPKVYYSDFKELSRLIRPGDSVRLLGTDKQTIVSKILDISFEKRSNSAEILLESCVESQTEQTWRIEKLDKNFIKDYRFNLFQLMIDGPHKQLFVRSNLPQLLPQLQRPQPLFQTLVDSFNEDQKNAFMQCYDQHFLSLIHGMPGTGKTKLLVDLLKVWSVAGQRVLVTSFNNQAVDNILQRFVKRYPQEKKRVARMGRPQSASQEASKYKIDLEQCTLQQVLEKFDSIKIYFTTILSLRHSFLYQKFDVCVLDQASQCIEPACLGPLLRAQRLVLIGDHFQLEPLVKSKQARGKLSVSLFQRMAVQFPHLVNKLTHQYRMNQNLMMIPNRFIYQGMLKADSSVQNRSLDIQTAAFSQLACIFQTNSPTFLCLDAVLEGLQLRLEKSLTRRQRAKALSKIGIDLSVWLTCCLKRAGVKEEQICIIGIYNETVYKLKKRLREEKCEVQVLTIDRSQGSEKQFVLLLIELIDHVQQQITENWRRVNVAFTRARSKLVSVGSGKSVGESGGVLWEIVEFMSGKGWKRSLQEAEMSLFLTQRK